MRTEHHEAESESERLLIHDATRFLVPEHGDVSSRGSIIIIHNQSNPCDTHTSTSSPSFRNGYDEQDLMVGVDSVMDHNHHHHDRVCE
jgi:hypothetical protein